MNSARVIAANSSSLIFLYQICHQLTIITVLVAGGVVHLIDAVLNPNSTNVANPDEDDDSPVNFPGASEGPIGLTSSLPTATATALVTTTEAVLPSDYSTPQPAAATSTTASAGDAASLPTGAIGAAALFGGVAILANF